MEHKHKHEGAVGIEPMTAVVNRSLVRMPGAPNLLDYDEREMEALEREEIVSNDRKAVR